MIKTWYNITTAEDKSSAEISIYDAIGGYDINAKQFVDELKEIKADTIHLRINSPGGSVIDGNAIFNALQRHDSKVVTHIDGLAASMASVVAMAGDEVHMADNALLMIHNPWTVSMGDADELRADADLLDKMSTSIINSYGRSQYEANEIKDLMDAETWFTAKEAFDAGLVDHIENGLRAAASDITALAKSSDLTVPTEKQIVSLTKQIEAITKASDDVKAQLAENVKNSDQMAVDLADALASLETKDKEITEVQLLAETANCLAEKAKAEAEAKDAEIVEAKKVTEEAVAEKAAELIQNNSHDPIHDHGDGLETDSDDQILARYESIADKDDRRDFFAANKTKILRAKARLSTETK